MSCESLEDVTKSATMSQCVLLTLLSLKPGHKAQCPSTTRSYLTGAIILAEDFGSILMIFTPLCQDFPLCILSSCRWTDLLSAENCEKQCSLLHSGECHLRRWCEDRIIQMHVWTHFMQDICPTEDTSHFLPILLGTTFLYLIVQEMASVN